MSKLGKREGPDWVEPVTIGNVRYEAPHWGEELGEEQNGGYLAAYDVSSGERLWVLKVYATNYDPDRERDVQDVFITRIAADGSTGVLTVEDEDGRQYSIDTKTRSVAEIG